MAKGLPGGQMTGIVGNLVFFVKNGKQCSRIHVKSNKSKTTKQHNQRAKFQVASRFVSQMLDVVKIGWPTEKSQHFNKAVSYHYNHALESTEPGSEMSKEEFRVNIEKVMMAKGEMPPPVITSLTRNNYEIEISWQTELLSEDYRASDSIVLAVWKPGIKAQVFTDLGNRINGHAKQVLPYEFQGKVHLWVFFKNNVHKSKKPEKNVSDSVYLGEV